MNETDAAPHDHVVFTDFDGVEGILVDLNTKKYFQLNETAMIIWKGLEKRLTTTEITGEIVANYDVTPEHAQRSVEKLVSDLRTHKLIAIASGCA